MSYIMSAYIPIIKLTQSRQGAKNLRVFYYGRATGHYIIPLLIKTHNIMSV